MYLFSMAVFLRDIVLVSLLLCVYVYECVSMFVFYYEFGCVLRVFVVMFVSMVELCTIFCILFLNIPNSIMMS